MNTMNHPMRTLMITGGHVTPALATIEEIASRRPAWRMVFVGRKHALEGSVVESEEHRLVTGLGIRFLPITAGRLKREGGFAALSAFLKIPVGLVQAFGHVLRERPDVIVSFGGYVALPVAVAAYMLRIPVVTHEQTTRPGLANRIIGRIAERICVSFPDTAGVFGDPARTVVTGLPVRTAVLDAPKAAPFEHIGKTPILLIVGGSTGSISINTAVFSALPSLLRDFVVIHQVGRASEALISGVRAKLPEALRKRYIAKAYLSAHEYSWAIHHAKIVIGRSGANTVTELALAGAVSVCIPLPWSANHEQLHNAQYLVTGGSFLLPQNRLSPETLLSAVADVLAGWDTRKALATRLSSVLPRDGARRFVGVVESVLARYGS